MHEVERRCRTGPLAPSLWQQSIIKRYLGGHLPDPATTSLYDALRHRSTPAIYLLLFPFFNPFFSGRPEKWADPPMANARIRRWRRQVESAIRGRSNSLWQAKSGGLHSYWIGNEYALRIRARRRISLFPAVRFPCSLSCLLGPSSCFSRVYFCPC